MERRKHISFEYYYRDKLCSVIKVNFEAGEVLQENHIDMLDFQFMGKADLTIDNVFLFLEDRCFEKGRADEQEQLESLGLERYDPESICRATHGIMCDDDFWIRFDDEDLTYKDIAKIKGRDISTFRYKSEIQSDF